MTKSHTSQHEPLSSQDHIHPQDDVGTILDHPVTPEPITGLYTPEQVQALINEALELGAQRMRSIASADVWDNRARAERLYFHAERLLENKDKWLKSR